MGGGGQFTLQPDNDYQLRMVVNKAKAAGANGLPLILGGSIDLRDGFTFTTSSPIEATPLQTLSGHSNIVWSVAYNRDGTLASASHDGTIRLWHAESGLELQTLSGHNGPISSVAYSPDGTTLASASHDPNSSLSNIQLWEVVSGSLLKTLSGHTDPIKSVAYSRDGTLASASDDGSIKLWRLAKEYPEVLSVTLGNQTYDATWPIPAGGATRVPTDVTLVLEFSESMNRASVKDSMLRITDVTDGGGPNASFDIQVQEAIDTSLIDVSWNGAANTEVTLRLNSPILVPGNEYKLQMVDNKAKAAGANGLPLILGGAIDLLSGFQFKTNNASVTANITLEVHMNAVNHEVLLLATDADLDDRLTFEINTNAFGEDGPENGDLLLSQ